MDTKTQFSIYTCSVSESISTPISNAGGVAFRFHFTEFSVIFFHPGALFSIRIVRERYFEIVHKASLESKNKIKIDGTPQTAWTQFFAEYPGPTPFPNLLGLRLAFFPTQQV